MYVYWFCDLNNLKNIVYTNFEIKLWKRKVDFICVELSVLLVTLMQLKFS